MDIPILIGSGLVCTSMQSNSGGGCNKFWEHVLKTFEKQISSWLFVIISIFISDLGYIYLTFLWGCRKKIGVGTPCPGHSSIAAVTIFDWVAVSTPSRRHSSISAATTRLGRRVSAHRGFRSVGTGGAWGGDWREGATGVKGFVPVLAHMCLV